MKKIVLAMASVVTLAGLPTLASAELTANIALTSNYKFRGQDQDQLKGGEVSDSKSKTFKPALQGGIDYDFGNGVYVGNWNSTVNWADGNSLETDFYGGYKGDLGQGLSYDVGALAYLYSGAGWANTGELYGALSYGPLTLKYSHTVSKKYFGVEGGRNTGYLGLSLKQEIAPQLSVLANVGYTNFSSKAKDNGAIRYMDYGVGLGYDIGEGFAVTGGLYGATKRSDYGFPNKNRFIVTVSKSL